MTGVFSDSVATHKQNVRTAKDLSSFKMRKRWRIQNTTITQANLQIKESVCIRFVPAMHKGNDQNGILRAVHLSLSTMRVSKF